MEEEWPENWRELLNKMPPCHRCGTHMSKLYLLSETYPNIEVCRDCAMDYHQHVKYFVEDINERQKLRC